MSNNSLNNSDVNTLINFFQTLSGFQKVNRFKVNIIPPKDAKLDATVLFATSVQIPQQLVTYYPDSVAPSGPLVDIPIRRGYDERFIMDFIVDKNWKTREFFDKWMDYMFVSKKGKTNSLYVKYYTDITGTVEIYGLDDNSNTNKKITLYDAYPTTIIPGQLSNDLPNDYLTLSVDMNYRYYKTG